MVNPNSENKKNIPIDSDNQLELLSLQCKKITPDLYKTYALYLQVLRALMLRAVRKAITSLIVNQEEIELKSFSSKKRVSFEEKIDSLVLKNNSLLTIEHLIDLSRQLSEEDSTKKTRSENVLLSNLSLSNESINDISLNKNIDLSLIPPIDNPSFINEWFIYDELDENLEEEEEEEEEFKDELSEDSLNRDNLSGNNIIENHADQSLKEKNGLEVLKSLFLLAGEAMESKSEEINLDDEISTDPLDKIKISKEGDNSLLPDSPISLLKWTNEFENALTIRLRDLSHLLNIELMRMGIVNSLVPITLLDAVLAGFISPQHAESNLLRLKVPGDETILSAGIEIDCLLIRPSELEFDDARLRACRSQIRKYRNKLLNMATKQRHWQSRSIAKEVEQQWWQNPPRTSTQN